MTYSFHLGAFDDLTALEYLNLRDNAIATLPADIFSLNAALDRLYMNDNAIATLPSSIFSQNTVLTALWLTGNHFTSLPDGLLSHNTALVELYLRDNSMATINKKIFDSSNHPSNLERLWLKNNPLDCNTVCWVCYIIQRNKQTYSTNMTFEWKNCDLDYFNNAIVLKSLSLIAANSLSKIG